jgi:hypothetical protein
MESSVRTELRVRVSAGVANAHHVSECVEADIRKAISAPLFGDG